MAVDEDRLLVVLTEFRDSLASHRQTMAEQVAVMERSYTALRGAVAGRAAEEFLQRSRRSRDAFAAYDTAVREITAVLTERIEALRGT
ncbi:hypothetical protein PO878_08505 [Iamia majanohamensis]|jgi:hypothetical protein|uniref:Uncharacterized protein n=1 Tax=Iamia majanohamensis TaxID=467976 RepID=A0AAE9Y8E8_9ACTN|nr:hypothetical protein [Iamia majanohamensis]WCO68764.1 hypothetical protein PO878_08505 [Iamia majanohamensis]